MKLNLGCASKVFDKWVNVDKVDYFQWCIDHNVEADLTNQIREYFHCEDAIQLVHRLADESCEAIAMIHFLDHFTPIEAVDILQQCYRLMKPGAFLRIEVEDLNKIINAWMAGTLDIWDEDQVPAYRQAPGDLKLGLLIFGNMAGTKEYTGHKMAYTAGSLMEVCRQAGFDKEKMRIREYGESSIEDWIKEKDTQPDHSLFLECEK